MTQHRLVGRAGRIATALPVAAAIAVTATITADATSVEPLDQVCRVRRAAVRPGQRAPG